MFWRCILIVLVVFSCKSEVVDPVGPTALTIVYPFLFGEPTSIPDDNPITEEGVDLGRHLFYDNTLSKDYTKSCSSCHTQENAFSDVKQFSEGVRGQSTTRNSMSLSNLLWQTDFFWDGRAKTLEEQALMPIQNPLEMDMDLDLLIERLEESDFYKSKFESAFPDESISATTLAKALSQFERTLISSNSRYDQYKLGLIDATAQEKAGEELFTTHPIAEDNLRGGNCGDCHSGFIMYSTPFSNNGLDSVITDVGLEGFTEDVSDRGKFKIPSLRNIALTAPYMHDGRFSTLEEVLDHYNEHINPSETLDVQITSASNDVDGKSLGLTDQEKEDIIAFLHMLTDETFISDESFSNPFE